MRAKMCMNKMAMPKAQADEIEREKTSHTCGICLGAQHPFGNRQFIKSVNWTCYQI